MSIENAKDLEIAMKKVVERVLPTILRESNNSIRIGQVQSYDPNSNTIGVIIINTNEQLSGIKCQKGVTTVATNSLCVLLSPDPKNKSLIFAIVY